MAETSDQASKRFQVQIYGPEGNEREGLWVYFGDTKDLKDLNKYKSVWRTEERIAYDEWTNIISQAQEDPDAVHSIDSESQRGGTKRKNTETNDEPEKRIKLKPSSPTIETVQQGERATDATETEGIVIPSANVGESDKQIKLEDSGLTVEATQHNEQAAVPEDIVDPSTNMDDKQLIELFLQVYKPLSPSVYVRISKLLQHHLKLVSPVSTALLKRVRDGAASWTHDYAAHFSKDSSLVKYVKKAPRVTSPQLLASIFRNDSANSKKESRTAPSEPWQAVEAYREAHERRKGIKERMALPRSKTLDDEESDSVRQDNARVSLQLFFRNDEVSLKNVPRPASSNLMQPSYASRELNAGLKRKGNLRTRSPDHKESEPVHVDGLNIAPRTSVPKLNQGNSPFGKIDASSNAVQRAVHEQRQSGPAFKAIEAGSKTAPRAVSPSLDHGASVFQTVEATLNSVPQATVSTHRQTSPSDRKSYTGFKSRPKRRTDPKAKYPEAKESDPVCTASVAPELGQIDVESQVSSPLRSAQIKSKSVPRTAGSAHGQTKSSKRTGRPTRQVSPGTLRAFMAKYPESKDRSPVRIDSSTTAPQCGWPRPEHSLGQACQALSDTEITSFEETHAIVAKYFSKAEENELVRMDQLKKALRAAVAPVPKHDEVLLMATYPGLDVKIDALLSDAVIAKHFVEVKESVAEGADNQKTSLRANSPGPGRTNQRYGAAFKKLVAELDAWRKDTYDFFAEHFPEHDGKE